MYLKSKKKSSTNYDYKVEYIKSLACLNGGINQIKELDFELEKIKRKMELFLESEKKLLSGQLQIYLED